YSIAIILLAFLVFDKAVAQDSQAKRYRADKFFDIKNFTNASEIYEELIASGEKDPLLMYKAGVSLLESKDIQKQVKAIPYIEHAYQNKDSKIPAEIDYYLGMAYHKNSNLHKAIDHLVIYKKSLS